MTYTLFILLLVSIEINIFAWMFRCDKNMESVFTIVCLVVANKERWGIRPVGALWVEVYHRIPKGMTCAQMDLALDKLVKAKRLERRQNVTGEVYYYVC